MYPRQDLPPYANHHQYQNTYFSASTADNIQYNEGHTAAWTNPPVIPTQPPQLQHMKMYPYQADTSQLQQVNNSRLDPTLAYPVALRPSAFEHTRFLDKMQPSFTRVKQEKYMDAPPYSEGLVPIVDPRLWTREDVATWLRWMSEAYSIDNLKPDRFEMNGKALCLMTLDMFLYRVPEGGRVLYHDFQRRLRLAVGS